MSDINIEERIKTTIAEIAPTAERMPGAVIIHDLRNWTVAWMSERAIKLLGVKAEDIIGKNTDEYHDQFFNREDAKYYVPKTLALIQNNKDDEIFTYFQQVRVISNPDWTWHMSSVKILTRDDAGLPLLAITLSIPIDAMHHMTVKASRLLEENNFLRKNFQQYKKLSNREIDILKFLALGKSATDTAEALFISVNTVETHRKNIRQKLGTNSFYELTQYARAFDLI